LEVDILGMPTKSNFLEIFSKDFTLKIFAIALAIVLWASINFFGSRTVTINDIMPDIVNMPTGLGLSENLPKVSIQLRAPRTINVSEEKGGNQPVRAFIDLGGSSVGERTVTVKVTTDIPNATIVSVVPNTIDIALDPLVEREVPVRVVPEGTPAEGFRIGTIQVDPQKIKIRAALGLFQRISSGVDAKINLNGVKDSFEGDAYLVLPEGTQSATDRVKVTVTIEQAEKTKTVGVRVKTAGNPQDGYFVRGITTDPVTVEISGVREIVDSINDIDTSVLSIQGLNTAKDADLQLQLPAGVASTQKNVKVHIDIAPLEGTKELNATISLKNIPDNLRLGSISPSTIRVSARGNGVESMRDGDVKVILDVSDRGQGDFTIQPKLADVQMAGQARAVSIESRDINIRLENR
jgi:YbbR domain-containing protein